MRRAGLILLALWPLVASAQPLLDFTAAERAAILRHGPWPAVATVDTSNRHAADPRAVALGRRLFFDPRLSAGGKVSCASCHVPARGFQDGRATAVGLAGGTRNTPGLLDVAAHRWFGWDGASDSLWAASLRPIVAGAEMGGSPAAAAALVRTDPALRKHYAALHGAPGDDDEAVLVHLAKALAAYQATLRSPRTRLR